MTAEAWGYFCAVLFGGSPIWFFLVMMFWDYFSDVWEENKNREIASFFSRTPKVEKPVLLSAKKLAMVEHEELSPEFFAWAKEHGVLDHPMWCPYCVNDRQEAAARENNKTTSRALTRLGLYEPVTEDEIWSKWNQNTHTNTYRNR